MGIVKEFKEFALKGNIMDLAVAVIIGAAFGKIVSSFVGDIVMPLINPLMPGGDWRAMEVGPGVKLGSFLGNTLDFVVITLVIFTMIKLIAKVRREEKEAPATPAGPTNEEKLLMEIRDALRNRP
ncbi:MAG: large conductance mechanosensitive channel protein MscL [Bacteroidota bacterium]|nr:large conductance mechanosensitive channel protein MscL [Bacteroidota bacterium]